MKLCTNAIARDLVIAITFVNMVVAEEVRTESFPSNRLFKVDVLLHVPVGRPTGLVVLLPAGDIHSYSERSGFTPSALPRMLATNGVMTLIPSPSGSGSYTSDASLAELERLISDVRLASKIPPGRLAIGGFSGGGLGAVRYAQFCSKGQRRENGPAAVFAVDSPLDYERWALACERYLKRLAIAGLDLVEDRSVLKMLREELGGPPTEAFAEYRRQSPVSTLVADGGNARLLKNTPVRIYIEPELKWRLENWNRDADSTNVPDATVLVSILRLLGNKDAELITTSGKGYRSDGSRNPHSWSIVDEPDLARWLFERLGRAKNGG